MNDKPSVVCKGMKWPGGGYVEVAVLDVRSQYLEELLGSALVEGVEAGLGRWRAIGARLKSGAIIELISYDHEVPERYTLRVGIGENWAEVLREALVGLGLDENSVLWRRSST